MPHPSSGGGSCPPHRVVLINGVCEAPRLVRALLTPHPHSQSAADVCHPHKSPIAAGIVPAITGVHFSSKFVGDGMQQSQMSHPPCWTAGLLDCWPGVESWGRGALPHPVPWRPGCGLESRLDFASDAGNSESSEQVGQVPTWNPVSRGRRSQLWSISLGFMGSDLEALGLKS